ncbi:MAG TPA: VWA domain-containing protein [Pyrinomonadaceae bacterium]|jgi:VWFA-related protein
MNILFKPSQVLLAFTAFSIIAAPSPVAAQEEVIRVETSLVNLNVVVTDRQGRRVSGLAREDFDVFEDGVRQEITHFTADERPLRLVLVFDVSVSMESVLPTVKQEAIALLGSLGANDELRVVSFASEVCQLSGWLNREQAEDVIRRVTPEPHARPVSASIGRPGYRIGDTNTYLYEAFRYLFDNFRIDDDRIAIVMFSDGVDTAAGRAMPNINRRVDEVGKEVRRQAQESWALVYPIRYKTEQAIGELPSPARRPFPAAIRIGSPPADPGRKLFEQIAATTGGGVLEWTTRLDLIAAVKNALADLRSQYGLAYTPLRNRGNGFRRTRVRVKRPNLVVRTREGYFYNREKG